MHNHGEIKHSDHVKLGEGFAFHPLLAKWLMKYLELGPEIEMTVHETGCTEESCPIEETLFVYTKNGEEKKLLVGRAKEKISKADLVFALEKQG